MNHAVTLAAAGSYTIQAEPTRIAALGLQNAGAGTLYYGDPTLPEFNIVSTENNAQMTIGSPVIVFEKDVSSIVKQGMVLSGDAGAVANFASWTVIAVDGRKVTMSANAIATLDGVDMAFTPPALNASTGFALEPGETTWFTASWGSAFLQQAMGLYSTAGTTVKIFKRWN